MPRAPFAAAVLALLATACAAAGDAEDLGTVEGKAFASPAGNRWLDVGGVTVPVCWSVPPAADAPNGWVDADVKAAVRDAFLAEYNGRTPVRLEGFQDCTAEDAARTMVRMRFETARTVDGPRSSSHPGGRSWVGPSARALGGEGTGELAWSSATAWFGAPRSWASASPFIRRATLRAALHEMGHALGLLHEHERPDAPDCPRAADAQEQGDTGNLAVGAYDAASIMNYCSTATEPALSEGDVAAVTLLFSARWPQVRGISTSRRAASKPGSAVLVLRGLHFDETSRVLVDGAPMTMVESTATSLTFEVAQAALDGGRITFQVESRGPGGEALRSAPVVFTFR